MGIFGRIIQVVNCVSSMKKRRVMVFAVSSLLL